MPLLRFEWDDAKESRNRRKHRVSFQEALTVFTDDRALFMEDPDHSVEEERFLLLGLSSTLKKLVVSYCYREREEVIRIITARRANSRERALYQRGWK